MGAGLNGITFDDLEWPLTRVSRSLYTYKSNISKTVRFRDDTNRKPYTIHRMVPLSMILSDLWPRFQGHDIFKSNIVKTARLKDKVTIAQKETIRNIWHATVWSRNFFTLNISETTRDRAIVTIERNRKSYALYRTVTFPMTLTDP